MKHCSSGREELCPGTPPPPGLPPAGSTAVFLDTASDGEAQRTEPADTQRVPLKIP